MSTITYHEAKKLIETGIDEYVKQFNGVELPGVEIERKGKSTSVKFGLGKDANLYNIVSTLVTTIGEMSIRESFGDLRQTSTQRGSVCSSMTCTLKSIITHKRKRSTCAHSLKSKKTSLG